MTLRISALFLLPGLIIGPVLRAQSVFHDSHAPQVSFASAEIGRALRLQGATPDRGMRDLTSDKSSLRFAIAAGADESKALAQTLRVAPLKTVLVQTSNWPNLLRRYAGSELGGHHSGPDCGHSRRSVRQLADFELFLPDLRCQFNSADRHRRRIEALEAQHRSDPFFTRRSSCSIPLLRYLHERTRTRLGIAPAAFNSRTARCEAAYASSV